MPLWGKKDQANNSPQFAGALVKLPANTAIRDLMYGNNTPNVFIQGATVGIFGADQTEVATNPGVGHPGWHKRTVGTGGRAGRVTYETLVAMRNITTDAEDTVLVDALLRVLTQPGNKSVANNGNTFFFANVSITPSNAANVQYRWQRDQGNGTWINISSGVIFSGVNTPNLLVNNVGWIGLANNLSGNVFRLITEVASGSPVITANSTLTVV